MFGWKEVKKQKPLSKQNTVLLIVERVSEKSKATSRRQDQIIHGQEGKQFFIKSTSEFMSHFGLTKQVPIYS